jgi:hypothetical protein
LSAGSLSTSLSNWLSGMLIAPGMWPGSYWRAAGRESMITTPFFGGMLTFWRMKS